MRRSIALPALVAIALVALGGCPLWPDPDPVPPAGTPPSITIVAPLPDAVLATAPDAARSVAIEFVVAGITLAAPGTCLTSDAPCGHVLVTVDDGACPGGAGPSNGAASGSPALASLRFCASAEGSHRLRLTLAGNDGAAILDAAGAPIEASVTVTATLPSLLDRLGGSEGIDRLAQGMVDRQLADPKINAYFRNASIDHAALAVCMGAVFAGIATGEPPAAADCSADMGAAHAGLGVSGVDFDDWLAGYDLVAAGLGIGAQDAAELRGRFEALSPQIVQDPTNDATLYQRLGRRPGLSAAVEVFTAHLLADPTVARYFLDENGAPDYSPTFGLCLTRLLGSLDGPFIYGEEYPLEPTLEAEGRACRSMEDAHEGLTSAPPEEEPIGPIEFLAVAGILVDTLVYLEVPQADIDLLVSAMNLPGLCLGVIGNPAECGALF